MDPTKHAWKLLRQRKLTPCQFTVFQWLARCCAALRADGCFMPLRRIEGQTGLAHSTVVTALARLEEAGLLTRTRRRVPFVWRGREMMVQGSNYYRLITPTALPESDHRTTLYSKRKQQKPAVNKWAEKLGRADPAAARRALTDVVQRWRATAPCGPLPRARAGGPPA